MSSTRYRYALEIRREDGSPPLEIPLTVDWEPAREWTWMMGVRQNRLQPTDSTRESAIRPIWNSTEGEPYVRGFSVELASKSGGGMCEEFTASYFNSMAQAAWTDLAEMGLSKNGDKIRCFVAAFPDSERPDAGPRPRFRTEEIPPDLGLIQSDLGSLTERSQVIGPAHPDDIPVMIPRSVLRETVELGGEAGAQEVGGILVGYLHRDLNGSEIFVEVTAQLPATNTVAEVNSLTFTAQTWTEARAALERRETREIFLGWWHTHPVGEWCTNCPPDKQENCPLACDFMSLQDRQLHRTLFPRAYTLSLVVNQVANRDATHSLFGWRRGLLEPRHFHAIDDVRSAPRKTAAATERPVGGSKDAA